MTAKQHENFDRLLEEVLATLPEDVRDLLEDVPVIVDEEPSPAIREDMGEKGPSMGDLSDLCGLHWGVPLSERGVFGSVPAAERIFLFRGPIIRLSGRNQRELKRQIRITLLHEIGHLFGLDEEELAELGYE